jgi:hypothetical protein
MKNTFLVFCAGLLAALVIAAPVLAKDPPVSAEQLRSELEVALKSGDTNAALLLINWEGVSERMKAFERENMTKAIQHGIVEVRLRPLAADYPLSRERNGVKFSPNVAALGLIEIEFAGQTNAGTTTKITRKLPYGKKTMHSFSPARLRNNLPLLPPRKDLSASRSWGQPWRRSKRSPARMFT